MTSVRADPELTVFDLKFLNLILSIIATLKIQTICPKALGNRSTPPWLLTTVDQLSLSDCA